MILGFTGELKNLKGENKLGLGGVLFSFGGKFYLLLVGINCLTCFFVYIGYFKGVISLGVRVMKHWLRKTKESIA